MKYHRLAMNLILLSAVAGFWALSVVSALDPRLFDGIAAISSGTAAYYAMLVSVLTMTGLITLAYGERNWGYLALIGITATAAMFWNELRIGDHFVFGQVVDSRILALVGHTVSATILAVCSRIIDPVRHLLRTLFAWGSVAVLLLGIVGAFSNVKLSFQIVVLTMLFVTFIGLIAVFFMPRLTDESKMPIIAVALLGWIVGPFNYMNITARRPIDWDGLVLHGRFTFTSIIGIGVYIAIRRVLALRDDRENVLKDQLEIARKEAQTNKALLESQHKYAEALEIAKLQRLRLAEASHDIKQPIASIRSTIDAIVGDQSQPLREQLRNSFDYLEQLASSYMDEAGKAPLAAKAERGAHDSSSENVAVSLFVETLDRMFRAEAEARGLAFETDVVAATVRVQPLTVMRIASNLVSNAIEHTDEGTISLGARMEEPDVILYVRNTGAGPSVREIHDFFEPYAKGPASSGAGLGLAIVKQLAENTGLELSFRTDRIGEFLEFSLKLPMATSREL